MSSSTEQYYDMTVMDSQFEQTIIVNNPICVALEKTTVIGGVEQKDKYTTMFKQIRHQNRSHKFTLCSHCNSVFHIQYNKNYTNPGGIGQDGNNQYYDDIFYMQRELNEQEMYLRELIYYIGIHGSQDITKPICILCPNNVKSHYNTGTDLDSESGSSFGNILHYYAVVLDGIIKVGQSTRNMTYYSRSIDLIHMFIQQIQLFIDIKYKNRPDKPHTRTYSTLSEKKTFHFNKLNTHFREILRNINRTKTKAKNERVEPEFDYVYYDCIGEETLHTKMSIHKIAKAIQEYFEKGYTILESY
jgi:hypothetical protein